MKLTERLDIIVLVLLFLFLLTGCTITTDPDDLGACLQWSDIQATEKECTMPLYGGERVCVYTPYVTSVCIARESSTQ